MAKEWTKKGGALNERRGREKRRVEAAATGERGSQDKRVTSVAGINLERALRPYANFSCTGNPKKSTIV